MRHSNVEMVIVFRASTPLAISALEFSGFGRRIQVPKSLTVFIATAISATSLRMRTNLSKGWQDTRGTLSLAWSASKSESTSSRRVCARTSGNPMFHQVCGSFEIGSRRFSERGYAAHLPISWRDGRCNFCNFFHICDQRMALQLSRRSRYLKTIPQQTRRCPLQRRLPRQARLQLGESSQSCPVLRHHSSIPRHSPPFPSARIVHSTKTTLRSSSRLTLSTTTTTPPRRLRVTTTYRLPISPKTIFTLEKVL